MRAATFPLPPFKVAVAGGGASLSGLQDIGVHSEAHAAARLTPLEPGLLENLIQSLCLRLLFDQP